MSRRTLRVLAGTSAVAGLGGTVYLSTRRTGHESLRPTPLRYDENGTIILPTFPKLKSREAQLASLKESAEDESKAFDLLVIGGGATGTGIALDAVTRGLKVALVESQDFASGTSSKSTKLIHGGVRYLEKAFWELDYGQ